jgi:predicted anti-sigma-YlaC factor YlaD
MDANHGITFAELYDYFLEHADTDTTRRVEVHLASCLACREMLRVMALLSGAPAEEIAADSGGHPLLEELVAYYKDAASLNPDTRRRIESHLAECADCRSELEFLQQLEHDMQDAVTTNPPQQG